MAVPQPEKDPFEIQRNLLAIGSGILVGLFFGVPPAWGAHTMGLPWMPYGIAVITIGLVVGMLMAFTVESLFPRTRTPIELPPAPELASDRIRRRLVEGKAALDRLDAQSERIVWGELLDLELQDIDEHVSRIPR